MENNYKLTLAYEGTHYYGWQQTIDGPSIEETLKNALEQLLRHPITLQAASRTDRGVHAAGQVVNFRSSNTPFSPLSLLQSLNKILPKDISITGLEIAPFAFHPTLDSTGKEYHYTLRNHTTADPFTRHRAWHIPRPLNLSLMHQAATHLLGTHDFTAFTNTRFPKHENTVCTLDEINIEALENHTLCIRIIGDHFLYKMVRNIVGTLAYTGLEKISPSSLPTILTQRERKSGGVTAPAHGLTLARVFYPSHESH